MAKYFIEDTTLTAIADAIREKEGGTEAIPVADYARRIAAISVGVDLERIDLSNLDSCPWKIVDLVSNAGVAASLWSVGDRKKITLNGTVGTLALSNYETYVYIIGFDHNGAPNTIDFGTFKTALSGGKDICLIDDNYDNSSTDGTKYFTMNHSIESNAAGWKGCDLRYDVLGSTDTYGGNATTTTATSPVPSTLMAALPSDLRAVMKPMIIYTDNTGSEQGGSSDVDANVTSSVDYLPLLAEFEVFGTRSRANKAEQNYQAQYAYYSAGNSKAKYRHSKTGSTGDWWERSPATGNSTSFCNVFSSSDYAGKFSAVWSSGIAPIFRV